VSVNAGRDAGNVFEDSREMTLVGEACRKSDFGEVNLGHG
jgi:hypothetical protein